MRNLLTALLLLLGLSACAGDDRPASCPEAVTHFYEAACPAYMKSDAQRWDLSYLDDCEKAAEDAAPDCQGLYQNLLVCLDSVPDTAWSAADCDCAREWTDFDTCQTYNHERVGGLR